MSESQRGIKKPGTGRAVAQRNTTLWMREIASESKLGVKHWRWNDVGWKMRGEYREVRLPDHPYRKGKRGWIDEHRVVAEIHLGRALLPCEEIHHINGDKGDNRLSNLFVAPTKSVHALAHASLQRAAYEAVKRGLITFADGSYEVAP